jgi:glucose dehydrogenase
MVSAGMRASLRRAIRFHTLGFGLAIMGVAYISQGTMRASEAKAHTTWSAYEDGVDSDQYSALKQIDKSNVSKLQQVWFYSAAGAHRFECNPIIVDKVMYVIGKDDNIVALDAATGREIWVHDNGKPRIISERGITYWESQDRSDRRLFFSTNNILHAIDARTGKLIDSFGDHGNIDLREGLGRDPKTIREIESGTPGRIFENLLILGSTPGEEYGSPPGDLRAFDVRTGKLVWTFHTVPHPGDLGYETWPKDAWKYVGGTNAWGGITIDEKRGIAYFPTGSPTYDFYGADRLGANLFSDCLIALDARTGKYLWHFQIVHHDLWDYDLATAPKLLTVKHDGRTVDVVAQPGKTGFLYVFDRVTGKPLWPIEERPVPKSYMPGEQAWPTQPFPTAPPPFATQNYTADDVDPYIADPAERAKLHDLLTHARNEGMFTPAGFDNTLQCGGRSHHEYPVCAVKKRARNTQTRCEAPQDGDKRFGRDQGANHLSAELSVVPYLPIDRSTAGRPFPGRHRVPRRCGPHPVDRDQWFITHAGFSRPLLDGHRFFDLLSPYPRRWARYARRGRLPFRPPAPAFSIRVGWIGHRSLLDGIRVHDFQ